MLERCLYELLAARSTLTKICICTCMCSYGNARIVASFLKIAQFKTSHAAGYSNEQLE